jgi:hypothetical protein
MGLSKMWDPLKMTEPSRFFVIMVFNKSFKSFEVAQKKTYIIDTISNWRHNPIRWLRTKFLSELPGFEFQNFL